MVVISVEHMQLSHVVVCLSAECLEFHNFLLFYTSSFQTHVTSCPCVSLPLDDCYHDLVAEHFSQCIDDYNVFVQLHEQVAELRIDCQDVTLRLFRVSCCDTFFTNCGVGSGFRTATCLITCDCGRL